jgi:hypothetical protein
MNAAEYPLAMFPPNKDMDPWVEEMLSVDLRSRRHVLKRFKRRRCGRSYTSIFRPTRDIPSKTALRYVRLAIHRPSRRTGAASIEDSDGYKARRRQNVYKEIMGL